MSATGVGGVDVAVEALGRSETMEQAFRMATAGGVAIVGVDAGKAVVPLELKRFVRRGIRVVDSFGCRVRSYVCETIRLAGEGRIDESAPVTCRYLLGEDPDPRMRALGAVALARIGGEEARAALRARLEMELDGQVVRRLLEGLAEDPSAEAARAMIRTLESPDPMIRAAALELLAVRTKLNVAADPRRPCDAKPFRAWWEATFRRPWE